MAKEKKELKAYPGVYAFGFTASSALVISIADRGYESKMIDQQVDAKDIKRFLDRETKKTKVAFVDSAKLVGKGELVDPSTFSKAGVKVIVCDEMPNLEGRFTVVDAEKGQSGGWKPIRLTCEMVEKAIEGSDIGRADVTKPSIETKIKWTEAGRFSSGSKKPPLEGLTRLVKRAVRGLPSEKVEKLKKGLLEFAVGVYSLDTPEGKTKAEKLKTRATKAGANADTWEDCFQQSVLHAASLSKPYSLLLKGKTVEAVSKKTGADEKELTFLWKVLGSSEDAA